MSGGDIFTRTWGGSSLTVRTCSWCHAENPTDIETCRECCHDAQRPRRSCRCGQPGCRPGSAEAVASRDWPHNPSDYHPFGCGPGCEVCAEPGPTAWTPDNHRYF